MNNLVLTDKIELQVEYLLNWLYNMSDAAIGIKSSWQPLINCAMSGGLHTGYNDPVSEGLIYNVSRKRKLEHILSKLDNQQQKILYYTFSDTTQFPPEVLKQMEQLSATILLLNNPEQIIKLCRRLLNNQASTQEKLLYQNLKRQAEFHYQDALMAFYKQFRNKK